MNYLDSIQEAISYIEQNILEDIELETIARKVYMSNFHFHRVFSLLTGVSVKEYIRNRRLSLAGQELLQSNKKVIDLAYKYGSFQRAFVRFHGITPKMAKHYGSQLKLYDPLVLRIVIQGGKAMNYRIEQLPAFTLLVKKRNFLNSIIDEQNNTEIPDFWDQCKKEGVFKQLNQYNPKGYYGVCSPISKEANHFFYGIGIEYEGKVPPDFELIEIEASTWAVFECASLEEMDDVWHKIYNEFIPNSNYTIENEVDLEFYPNNNVDYFCEIWIPVIKK